ncbi:MAG: phosphoenolpyruvate--protein phosphotransferase [Planctomycetes bacterium]|nr:phosphoenolpyruvate--protein phosphotransferase [Planctomycetota bacterium]
MEIKRGIGVSPGIGIAEAFVLDSEEIRIPERSISPERVRDEMRRFDEAVDRTRGELLLLRDGVPDDIRGIFDFHIGVLSDEVRVLRPVRDLVGSRHFTPEHAVSRVFRPVAREFEEIGDPYFSQRVEDVRDVERRLLGHLVGKKAERLIDLGHPVCVISRDLSPGETALLSRSQVAGFATDRGGPTSHTAILARALGIPAVVGLGQISSQLVSGDTVIIDGSAGKVIVAPDPRTLDRYRALAADLSRQGATLAQRMRRLDSVTADGVRVSLLANIEFPDDIEGALSHGADGVGLFRTEFLFIEAGGRPSEAAHLGAYQKAVESLGGRPIIFRTLDFGADKFPGAGPAAGPREDNPFLGCRSIRLALRELETFKIQLRAILKASARGPCALMFPMVSSVEELRAARMVLKQVQAELKEAGVEYRAATPVGATIETPGAALIADALAEEADFFSIGTNDLVQYTLAVDRGNPAVAAYYRPHHQAVWRLIRHVVETGARRGREVSICGEIAGDATFTMLLLGLGLRMLSLTPHLIPEVKRVIRAVTIEECEALVRRAEAAPGADEALNVLRAAWSDVTTRWESE